MKKIISYLAVCLCMSPMVQAQEQTIQDYLDSYLGENAVPYLQPLADLFASNINTGIWEWSKVDSTFYFRIKAQAISSFPSASMRTFTGHTTGTFTPPQSVEVPTIVGDVNSVAVHGDNDEVYVFPGGYDLKRLILGTPQVTIGGLIHTEVSGRFLSFSLGQDLGTVRFIGIGIRHSLSGYFHNPPIDFSIGYFYHHIEASTYLDSDQHLLSAQVGKSGKILSGQIMVGIQTSASDLHYVYVDGEDEYNVDLFLRNNNPLIMEASAGLKLGPIFASGALSYTNHVSVSLGVGFFFLSH